MFAKNDLPPLRVPNSSKTVQELWAKGIASALEVSKNMSPQQKIAQLRRNSAKAQKWRNSLKVTAAQQPFNKSSH